jgi:hypothetical protein
MVFRLKLLPIEFGANSQNVVTFYILLQVLNVLNVVYTGCERAVAQAGSRWLPTAAARVQMRAACGVCCGQSGKGAGFLRELGYPLLIIPPISPSS